MSLIDQSERPENLRDSAPSARVRVPLLSLAVVLSFLIGAIAGMVAYRYAATKGKPQMAQPTPAPAPVVSNPPTEVATQPAVNIQGLLRSVAFQMVDGNAQVNLVLEQPIPYDAHRLDQPDRVYLDLHGARLAPDLAGKTVFVNQGGVSKIRMAQSQPDTVRVVLDLEKRFDYSVAQESNPPRLVVKLTPHATPGKRGSRRRPSADDSRALTVG